MKAYKGGKFSSKKDDIDPDLLRLILEANEGEKIVIPNKSEKQYSGALLELIKPYYAVDVGVEELDSLFMMATVAWNMAVIKKEVPISYGNIRQETKKDFASDKKAIQLIEALSEEKNKKFADYEMLIYNNEIKFDKHGEASVKVLAKLVASFLLTRCRMRRMRTRRKIMN